MCVGVVTQLTYLLDLCEHRFDDVSDIVEGRKFVFRFLLTHGNVITQCFCRIVQRDLINSIYLLVYN